MEEAIERLGYLADELKKAVGELDVQVRELQDYIKENN